MFETFIKYLTFEKRYSPHTISAYTRDLNQLAKFIEEHFDNIPLQEVTYNILRSWVIDLVQQQLSSKSINRKIISARSFYNFLLRRGEIDKNPASKLTMLRSDRKLPVFVQEEEILRLLDNASFDDDFNGYRDKIIIELFYNTGMREAELIGLKESDVNMHDMSIKVLGKRNKERLIPLSKSFVRDIKIYIDKKNEMFNGNADEHLIVSNNGNKCYPMFIYRTVNKYLRLFTNVDKASPHILRHTFATHLLNKGADLNAVKELLGHQSLSATQIYTHNSMDKLKRIFEQAHPKA